FETVLHMPWSRLVLGYGPDAAHFAYYAHIPYDLMVAVGAYDTIDRLHNDLLDLITNTGLLAAVAYVFLVSALMWYAARGIFPDEPHRPGTFAAVSLLAAIVAACAAVSVSGRLEWLPVAWGLGLA